MKIGDRVFVRGYIDEIRKDTVIVRNDGGYFGTIPSEVITGELSSAQPKRGKWIKYEQEFMLEGSLGTVQKTVRECSVCTAKIAGMVGIMNFCPNCGADMRGEQDE